MLDIRHVSKRYGKVLANDDLSFYVEPGQLAVLLGPNGAGKSTIIKCIAGLLRFQGQIRIGGFDNKSLDAKALLGYIPETPAIYEALTVGEHLEFIRRAYRVTEGEAYGDALLERFSLMEKKNTLGRELSKGMQQKLSICCALVHRPRMVIFDEPMVGLDPYAIKELKELFRELQAAEAALLISTHMIDSVEDYWSAVHIMMRGKIAATRRNTNGDSHTQSLEELFFSVTGQENGGEPQ